MDPRDTPGYRTHCALSNLSSIDLDQLGPTDRERIKIAASELEDVSYLTVQSSRQEKP